MKKKTLRRINFLIIAVVILLLSGCYGALFVLPPVVGSGLGALADAQKPDIADTIPAWELKKINPGAKVIINLKDGNQVNGKYTGVENISEDRYAEKYAKSQEQNPSGIILPEVGDTITLSSIHKDQNKLIFLGFGYNYIMISSVETNEPVKMWLENIEKITYGDGNEIEAEVIRNLMSKGEIPLLTAIAVEGALGKILLPIDEVDQIQIETRKIKKNGILAGFLAGAGIDVAILVGFILWFYGPF